MTPQIQRTDVVLVVDDSPDALSLINDALETAGLDVLVALEGKQALTIARRIRPDIILLDAVMPHLDGFDTCRALKTDPELAAIPVIFMTGLTDPEDIVRGLNTGGVDYLTKPINPEELLARMRVHLNNARLTNSAQTALDRTGQTLLTVDAQGQIRWATPQAHALLARAQGSDSWQQGELAEQVAQWLSHGPEPEHQLGLTGLDQPLSVRLIARQDNGETLLKLIEDEHASGPRRLKETLGLTDRESQVLYWVANGKTNREVAQILEMSPRTVNKHLETIFHKLEVDNRTSAAGIALRKLAML
ncbi:response regulator transcription factor [Saccharospirillum salsuginis]|uniref:DNA-binding response regulator n=1 Tax=Saccharospirillum salsuginis TaxID=418750 RepID=A0A918N7G0_9GAMM|nr:response regulator transcription factor [Saccharospirillum salsuginis]GGX43854.1 DNA-binding response regulator [Saccharospirillum salsuginis]